MTTVARRMLGLACGLVLTSGASALAQQVPTVLLTQGDPIGPFGDGISAIGTPSLNSVGGFVVRARTGSATSTSPSASFDFVYGRRNASAASTVMLEEGTIAGLNVQSIGSGFYLTDAETLGYGVRVGTTSPASSAALIDTTKLARVAEAFPSGLGFDGKFFGRDLSLAGVTSTGVSYLTTTVNNTAAVAQAGELGQVVLRRAANGSYTKLLQTGQSLGAAGTISPEVSGVSNGNSPISGMSVSRDGAHWVATVDIDPTVYNANTNPFPIQNVLVKDGVAATTASGAFVKEDELLGAGDNIEGGETIRTIGRAMVNNAGTVAATIRLGGTSAADREETIMVGGRIRYREQQLVAGQRIAGLINNAELNNNGDLLWSYTSATATGTAALFLNDERLIAPGMMVDTDGNGSADTELTRFFEALGAAVSDRDASGNVTVMFLGATDGSAQVTRLFRVTKNLVGSKWNLSGGGAWVAGSFTGGSPDSVGARASFTNQLSTAGAVTLGGTRTAGVVTFDSTVGYTLSGGSLALDNGTGHQGDGTSILRVVSGSHTINSPISVGSPQVSVRVDQAGSVLTLGQNLTVSGQMYKVGAGRLDVPKLTVGTLAVDDGTLKVTGGQGLGVETSQLIITNGGFLDLGVADLIVHAGDEAELRAAVARWWADGARTGTGLGTSASTASPESHTTVAVFPNRQEDGSAYFSTFDGLAVSNTDVIVRYTYIGDTDLNGIVNGADLATVIEGLSTGATGWVNGDVTYDGVVDLDDYTRTLAALNAGLPSLGSGGSALGGGSGAVPEPAGLALLAGLGGVLGRRRR